MEKFQVRRKTSEENSEEKLNNGVWFVENSPELSTNEWETNELECINFEGFFHMHTYVRRTPFNVEKQEIKTKMRQTTL